MTRTIRQTTQRTQAVPGGQRLTLEFGLEGSPSVPAVLLLPESDAPVPAVLLIHGYSSRKEDLADTMGRALLPHRIASLAIDLPLHGTRRDPVELQAARNPLGMTRLWRLAGKESRLAVRYLQARREIDRDRVAVSGYSLGSFLAVLLAAEEPAVRALVVAAGGDLPAGTPFSAMARMVADPLRAVGRLAGRPLLMVHGRRDRTVLPEQAERLFAAAREPKEIRWWDSGHYLPQAASEETAAWLARHLAEAPG
jgi:uncharacterized protein